MKRVVIDFDGTICENRFPDVGDPKPNVAIALHQLRENGWYIIIHTCRTSSYWQNADVAFQLNIVEEYLNNYGIPFDEICTFDKPVAVHYIDDRAITFDDNWIEIVDRLTSDKS